MSRIALGSVDPDVVARLADAAARRPAAYRLTLAAIAIAGDAALTLVTIFPFALPIVFGVVYLNVTFFYVAGGVAMVVLAWVFRPSMRFDGRAVTREEAPELHAAIDELRRKLDVPGRLEVHLDASFNASAGEDRGLWGLVGTRRVLTLGVPLLLTLGRQPVLGVIGHELGHFSRRHGRLGHWLYRAREGWLHFAAHTDDTGSILDRTAAWYASHFVPWFSVRSFVHSRQCEYEADADGAHVTSRATMAAALVRISAYARLWGNDARARLRRRLAELEEPPADLYGECAAAVRECSPERFDALLDETLRMPPTWLDTHPGLAERLRALGEAPRPAATADDSATRLFGSAWPALLAEFNEQYRRGERREWIARHMRIRHVIGPLLDQPEAVVAAMNDDDRLARARALSTRAAADGIDELRRLHERSPAHAGIAFALGSARLDAGDATAAAMLEAVAKTNPLLRYPAYDLLERHHRHQADLDRAERYAELRDRALRRREDAAAALLEATEPSRLPPSTLGPGEVMALRECLRRDPCVAEAWAMTGETPLADRSGPNAATLRVHVLVLAVDYGELQRAGIDEDDARDAYGCALARLLRPEEEVCVNVRYITQTLPPALLERPRLLEQRA